MDNFSQNADSVTAPARAPYAITPHDTNPLPVFPKAIYVGTGGTIILRGVDGTADVTLKNVQAGQELAIRARFIRATGTTAADLVALV